MANGRYPDPLTEMNCRKTNLYLQTSHANIENIPMG